MTQVTEPRASASTHSTIQDVFLNFARRDRLIVTIHLMDGRQLEARIKHFDKFAVVVEAGGHDQLIFKHAIATIETSRTVANYFSSHP
ncbi:MAG TPA: RNA chaperone Hfq [Vicinamibacterales bacterium]|nr:RNA chaperone Hfq [Vicinamibacterales bacterium]